MTISKAERSLPHPPKPGQAYAGESLAWLITLRDCCLANLGYDLSEALTADRLNRAVVIVRVHLSASQQLTADHRQAIVQAVSSRSGYGDGQAILLQTVCDRRYSALAVLVSGRYFPWDGPWKTSVPYRVLRRGCRSGTKLRPVDD